MAELNCPIDSCGAKLPQTETDKLKDGDEYECPDCGALLEAKITSGEVSLLEVIDDDDDDDEEEDDDCDDEDYDDEDEDEDDEDDDDE